MPFIDILIFAVIAIFLILRLRSILGNRDGFEAKREEPTPFTDGNVNEGDRMAAKKVVPLHGEDDTLISSGLAAVRQVDPHFSDEEFMKGAASAFTSVLTAFAECDIDTLRRLLSFELYADFIRSIHKRNQDGDQLEIKIDEIHTVQLIDGQVINNIASVTVKFETMQTRILKDENGNIISEESLDAEQVIDTWVFERDIQLSDPNWKLVETRLDESRLDEDSLDEDPPK